MRNLTLLTVALCLFACGEKDDTGAAAPNQPPEAPSIVLGPTDPTTTDDLVASLLVEPSDPDGDEVTVEWSWFRDGVAAAELTADTVPADQTAKGETWMAVAVATDGELDSEPVQAEITVVNTPPEISVGITPESPETDDDLVAELTSYDADGDELDLSWSWTMDGSDAGVDGDTLSAEDTRKEQTWAVTVTVDDGEASTDPAMAEVTIANALPVVESVTLAPDPATTTDPITAGAIASDVDEDPVALLWAWTVDGVAVTSAETDLLPPDAFTKGQTVVAQATPYDGTEEGDPVSSDGLVVSNTPPTLTGVSLDPSAVYEATTVACVPEGWADEDGDSESYAYEWTVDGSVVSTGETLDGASFDKHQEIGCTVTPSDGEADGEPAGPATTTVLNTAPILADATLDDTSPQEADTVSVTLGPASDDDGDAISYSYEWVVDGRSASSASTLTGSDFDKGEDFYVLATPDDGEEDGAAIQSDTGTAVNTAPVIGDVTLEATDLYTDEVLYASVSASDDDDDELSYTYAWHVDGTLVTTTSEGELDGERWFEKHESVHVEVTPDDGDDSGSPVSSSSVAVLNTPPPRPTVSLGGDYVDVDVDLVCEIVADDDADGDTVTYDIVFEVDGAAFYDTTTTTHPDDTVLAEDTNEDEVWTCTATPDDGEEEGDSDTTSTTISACTTVDALSLDGSSYGQLGSTRMMDMGTGTVEAWVYVDGDEGTLFSIVAGSGGGNYLESRIDSNQAIEVSISTASGNSCGSGSGTSSAQLDDGYWNHVVFGSTEPGAGWLVCINGSCETVASGSGGWGSCIGSDNFRIGASFSSGESDHLAGYLDEIRVWSSLRSSSEVADNMFATHADLSGESDLMAWYTLDEPGSGGTITDETGSYDGTWYGSDSDYQTVEFCLD